MENGTTISDSQEETISENANTLNDDKEQENDEKEENSNELNVDEGIIKMRGLPWSATVADILSFLGKTNNCICLW